MTLNSLPKRYLFQVEVTLAKGTMVWSVQADDEETAMKALLEGTSSCKLVFDQIQIVTTERPKYVGPDQQIIRGPNV